MLVTGVRLDESDRRMGHVEAVVRNRAKVWVAPILNWSTDDKNDYIDREQIHRNPVVANLCMSGECLCGAFANPGEITEIETFYPEAAARIRRLQDRARDAGFMRFGERDRQRRLKNRLRFLWRCVGRAMRDGLQETARSTGRIGE